MHIKTKSQKRVRGGFTLIELLVVISIIGLLASVVLASLNSARGKARDAKRISEMREVQKALVLYFDTYGKYPNETPVSPWAVNFTNMAQQLITAGLLGSVPTDPTNSGAYVYQYYNYGVGSGTIGGLLVSYLEAAPPTTTGYGGTCRPWGAGQNWCDQSSNTFYCICNPY